MGHTRWTAAFGLAWSVGGQLPSNLASNFFTLEASVQDVLPSELRGEDRDQLVEPGIGLIRVGAEEALSNVKVLDSEGYVLNDVATPDYIAYAVEKPAVSIADCFNPRGEVSFRLKYIVVGQIPGVLLSHIYGSQLELFVSLYLDGSEIGSGIDHTLGVE